MLPRLDGESCFECPNLNATFERRLVDGSVPPVSGSSDFGGRVKFGTVIDTLSRGSEDCDATQ